MAKINAHGLRQIGPTLFTERIRKAMYDGDVDTVYYEAWRLRSDGVIQSRIIRTWPLKPAEGHRPTEHNSTFRNWRKFKGAAPTNVDPLRRILEKLKADVVKEQF